MHIPNTLLFRFCSLLFKISSASAITVCSGCNILQFEAFTPHRFVRLPTAFYDRFHKPEIGRDILIGWNAFQTEKMLDERSGKLKHKRDFSC
jgi:hypothetical protein